MKRGYKKRTIRICEWCYQSIEYHNGKQLSVHIWVNPKDEKESFCQFCKQGGFDSLYVI